MEARPMGPWVLDSQRCPDLHPGLIRLRPGALWHLDWPRRWVWERVVAWLEEAASGDA